MKVALVTYALNVGGMESFMFGLARSLRDLGQEVEFVVTEEAGAWQDAPRSEGFAVRSVLPRQWQSSRGHAGRVASLLRRYDAAILNHSRAAQSAAGLLPDRMAVISVLHNDNEGIYCVGLANGENVDRFVAVGEQVRRGALERGASPDRLTCIRNGVEVFPAYPRGEGPPRSAAPLKVACLGRIEHEQKGVLYLPGIMARVRECGGEAVYTIIGDGTDSPRLQERIRELGLAPLVTFHGAVGHDRAMALLAGADVLIMPSRYEGQPITLFEAMARGVVPLVSRLPGITDTVIEEGSDGLLAPVGDEDAFARHLVFLAANRERVGAMSRAAWYSARERFGIDTMTRRYADLLEECLGARRAGTAPDRSGRLYLPLLGKRSRFPLFLHEAKRSWQCLWGGKGSGNGI